VSICEEIEDAMEAENLFGDLVNNVFLLLIYLSMSTLSELNLLDIVALKNDLPQHRLLAGQVGTIIEILALEVYEVEFSDDDGQTYATQALSAHQLLKLHYKPMSNSTSSNIHQHGSGKNNV
jgi:hypothetical protein